MKKVLIVTYYWPPAGGPGVQRVLKFVKYLPEFGWQPVVLTVRDGEYHATDHSLADEIPEGVRVYTTRSWEPHALYKRFTGMASHDTIPVSALAEENPGLKKRLAFWLRGNLFIPDARIGWIPAAVKKGKEIVREHGIDLVFSSSPPQTVHLIAKRVSAGCGLRWAADFRDPWTNIYYYPDYRRMWMGCAIDARLERSVLTTADRVIAVSRLDIDEDFARKALPPSKFRYIPNGYDEEDFARREAVAPRSEGEDAFEIVYAGTLKPHRVPLDLFHAVYRLHEADRVRPDRFRMVFIGNVHPAVREMEEVRAVSAYVTYLPYMPHSQLTSWLDRASALLLVVDRTDNNRNVIPGKVFEYLRCRKPILAFGPDGGEIDRVLRYAGFDGVIPYDDDEKASAVLQHYMERAASGAAGNQDRIQEFERKHLTQELSAVFDALVSKDREDM